MKRLLTVLAILQVYVALGETIEVTQNGMEPENNPRDKRSLKYKVLESTGLTSHFQIHEPLYQDEEEHKINRYKHRARRQTVSARKLHSDEIEVEEEKRDVEKDDLSTEDVPLPEKQTMKSPYYRSDENRLMESWVKAPYENEFASRVQKEEEDSQPEASNIGINARTPRVNFITQQGQKNNKDEPDGPEARDKNKQSNDDKYSNNNNNNNNNNNRKPQDNQNNYNSYNSYPNYQPYGANGNSRPSYNQYPNANRDPSYYQDRYPGGGMYDRYPTGSNGYDRYPMYDRYPSGYEDRRYEMMNMIPPREMGPPQYPGNPYYRPGYEYEEYMARMQPNYFYPNKRYDQGMPPHMEGRDYDRQDPYRPYLNNNDVNGYASNRNAGRIIYYAHLPEIVRTPSNPPLQGDQRYRSAYPSYYYNNMDRRGQLSHNRDGPPRSAPLREEPESTTLRVSSSPIRAAPSHVPDDRPFRYQK